MAGHRLMFRTANALGPDMTLLEVRDAPGPRAVVFTDMYYPGWMAFVDGEPAPLYRANGVAKAVVIPKGTHEVRFAFRPWRVGVGVTVSIAAFVAGLASLLWCFKIDRTITLSEDGLG